MFLFLCIPSSQCVLYPANYAPVRCYHGMLGRYPASLWLRLERLCVKCWREVPVANFYGLTAVLSEGDLPLVKRPIFWAGVVGLAFVVLNIIFW